MKNYRRYTHDGTVFAVRTNVETDADLFVRTGQTANIRGVAAADAVLYNDALLDVLTNDGRVILQDPWAGVRERFYPPEWFDTDLETFERIRRPAGRVRTNDRQ